MINILDKPQFKNKICKKCIKRNLEKYGKFDIDCNGITVEQNVKFAIKNGYSEDEARWMYDTRYFFEKVYGSAPRDYQEEFLLCTSKKLVARQCRQTGKTLVAIFRIMHYLYTNENKTVLIVTPNEAQIKKIYDEYILRDCLFKNEILKSSIVSKSQKPFYTVKLCNGSTVILMVASETVRGQTNNWIYIDEAAIIGSDLLNSILMTVASKGKDAVMMQTSTPKGRGNPFYRACKEFSDYNEIHVSIHDVPSMTALIPTFKRQLGEYGFKQEAEAEFPDVAGGPFNYKGIDLAKSEYEYDDFSIEEGCIYIGGVDWNGPVTGSFFTVIAFNPAEYTVKVVDKKIVSSVEWNSLAAKQALIDLNRKWNCSHWMVDKGYGSSIVEELKLYSMNIARSVGRNHPDTKIKNTIDAIDFGSFIVIKDPFTKEDIRKTTKSFMVQQAARLFEPINGTVSIKFPKSDNELIEQLENYKLLNTTSRGYEQYGFEKGDGIEDHLLDSLVLAIYGVVKYYNELFKRVIYQSAVANTNAVISTSIDPALNMQGKNLVLISDTDNTPIEHDEAFLTNKKQRNVYGSSTFSRSGIITRSSMSNWPRGRSGVIRRTSL